MDNGEDSERNRKIIFTKGISTSGKTTWAEQYCRDNPNTVNINRDDLRFTLFTEGVRDWGLYKFTKARERRVTEEVAGLVLEATLAGKDIVISDTNLNDKYLTAIKALPCLSDYTAEIKEFPISLEDACQRDARRANGVGVSVLHRQYKSLKKDGHDAIQNGPKAVIVDIDGTIADMTGIRHPFEWDKVPLDRPREEVIIMVKGLMHEGYKIVFMSGRDSCCEKDTRTWLNNHFSGWDIELYMRPEGSREKDTIIKAKLFRDHVQPKYNVVMAIDDRPCILKLWLYEFGIKNVISVGNPYIEF